MTSNNDGNTIKVELTAFWELNPMIADEHEKVVLITIKLKDNQNGWMISASKSCQQL